MKTHILFKMSNLVAANQIVDYLNNITNEQTVQKMRNGTDDDKIVVAGMYRSALISIQNYIHTDKSRCEYIQNAIADYPETWAKTDVREYVMATITFREFVNLIKNDVKSKVLETLNSFLEVHNTFESKDIMKFYDKFSYINTRVNLSTISAQLNPITSSDPATAVVNDLMETEIGTSVVSKKEFMKVYLTAHVMHFTTKRIPSTPAIDVINIIRKGL